ncbi:MAG: hypothetical protein JW704_06950 [Anaerolineaceae bacterium]|nr:hypothetical protein [Anaerolineaceae bacterium]MBN2677311.1 hypothetical protein [Anaerolineaceae bacterium]
MKRSTPALFLFVLSPVCGELLSSSSPPSEFFKPLTLLTLCALYGGGAVLVRETVFRWKRGWISILILGAAYGIIEEGLMVKSFFDPEWMDLGILGSYGRWLGINWVWTVELTIFHAVFSIGIPILVTTLLFPSRRQEPWVSRSWLTVIMIFFVLDVAFGNLVLTTYKPPLVHYLGAIFITGLLMLWARKRQDPAAMPGAKCNTPPAMFGLLGFAATILFYIIAFALPGMGIPPLFTILSFGLLVCMTGALIWRISGYGNWQTNQLAGLVSGALIFFFILAPIIEMDQARTDDTTGMSWVGIIGMILLILFNLRVRSFEQMTGD